jgi:SAM-dependent methyltransferase
VEITRPLQPEESAASRRDEVENPVPETPAIPEIPPLSDPQLLWLFARLSCPDPAAELERIRRQGDSLIEACLAWWECGESLSDAAFVKRGYSRILGREPDEKGLQSYIQALEKGETSRIHVVGLFLSSVEFQQFLDSSLAREAAEVDVVSKTVQMEQDWDKRARENALYYIDTDHSTSERAFEKSGEWDLENHVLQGIELRSQAIALEIGCGIGRLLKPLAQHVAKVIGVDISGEMVREARARLAAFPNIQIHKTETNLSVVESSSVDFCFSYVVFQHFPAKKPVFTYFEEASRVLRPGGIFRFQINQRPEKFVPSHVADTWDGVGIAHAEVAAKLEQVGFKILDRWGEMTHCAWYTAEETKKARSTELEAQVRYRRAPIDRAAVEGVFERIGEKLSDSTLGLLLSGGLAWRTALDSLLEKWSSMSDEEYVRSVHRALLNQEIDTEALRVSLSLIQDGRVSRSLFLDSLLTSKEFRDVLGGLKGFYKAGTALPLLPIVSRTERN